jgi:hypothetical protein
MARDVMAPVVMVVRAEHDHAARDAVPAVSACRTGFAAFPLGSALAGRADGSLCTLRPNRAGGPMGPQGAPWGRAADT